jgi:uncharacterized membrane protein (UPF0127 family)
MKDIKVINKSNQASLENIKVTTNSYDRLLGLMFKDEVNYSGLLVKPCNGIHTFFMKFPIDAYFINKKGTVIKKIKQMNPWRMSLIYFNSDCVLELDSRKENIEINLGDQLEFVDV